MPVTPPSQPSIKVTVSSPRKGGSVNWSNRWFFTGGALTLAQFNALRALLEAEYKLILPATSTIVEYTQYDPGSDVPVRTASVSVAGTLPLTGGNKCPSDATSMLRFSTSQRTSKNHPIYLFKYFHACLSDSSTNGDFLQSTLSSRLDSFGNDVVAGFNDGTSVRNVTGPYGAVAIGHLNDGYVNHRDFPK
jgi:hypothetical protein